MLAVLMEDEMGHGKRFTSLAVGMICKLLTEMIVLVLQLSILWVNTVEEWGNMAQNNDSGISSKSKEWDLLQRLNSEPHHLLENQTTPLQGHPAFTSAHEPIPVVTIPRGAETLKSVIDKRIYKSNFQ
jgi:hypothetical protein